MSSEPNSGHVYQIRSRPYIIFYTVAFLTMMVGFHVGYPGITAMGGAVAVGGAWLQHEVNRNA